MPKRQSTPNGQTHVPTHSPNHTMNGHITISSPTLLRGNNKSVYIASSGFIFLLVQSNNHYFFASLTQLKYCKIHDTTVINRPISIGSKIIFKTEGFDLHLLI